MCVELSFSGGTLARNGDLTINRLDNPRHLWKMCQDIGLPRLGIQIKFKGDNSAVVQNTHKFHNLRMKQFVVPLGRFVSTKTLDEFQRAIMYSDTKVAITKSNNSPQRDNYRTHRHKLQTRG